MRRFGSTLRFKLGDTMNLRLLTLTIIVTSTNAMAVECTALKSYDNGRQHITLTEELKPIVGYEGKIEAEIEDAYFTFSENGPDQYSAKIIMAPDYLNGVSTNANFDMDGNLSLAKVTSSTRIVLNCKR